MAVKTVRSVGPTEREKEVLICYAEGLKARQIGEKLGMSARTVECHRSNIGRKLNLRNIADLVKYAVKHGMVSIDGVGR